MKSRLNWFQLNPDIANKMSALSSIWRKSGLEESLIDLVLMRASQINRCAYCLDMHFKDARASGETEQRLYSLDAWRETPYYTDRERAALAWTEAVTLVTDGSVSDAVYEEVRPHFSDDDLMSLTLVIIDINSWNRLNVSLRTVPGYYKSQRKPASELNTANS